MILLSSEKNRLGMGWLKKECKSCEDIVVSGQCFWYVKAFCNGVSVFTNGSGTQASWGSVLRDRHCRHLKNLLKLLQTKNLPRCHQAAFFDIVLRQVSVTCFVFFAKLEPWALGLLIAICRSVSILVQFSYIRLSSLGSPFVAASSLFPSWSRCAFSCANAILLEICAAEKWCLCGRLCNRRKIFCKQVLYYERDCPNPGLATKF